MHLSGEVARQKKSITLFLKHVSRNYGTQTIIDDRDESVSGSTTRNIFLQITMQLSRLIWWDDFIKLTEDTKYRIDIYLYTAIPSI